MTTYTVKAVNGSKTAWTFFLYQVQPGSGLTLAWFVTPIKIPIQDAFVFNWQTNYQFIWSHTGPVRPRIIVKAGGQTNCDPEGANTTRFTYHQNFPQFSHPVPGGAKGTLTIRDAEDVPKSTFAVGIGMSGIPTNVETAEPKSTHTFTSPPVYYIAAIDEVMQGEVMDIKTITKTAEIKFPTGVHNMTAILNAENKWIFTPTSVGQGAQVPQVGQVTKAKVAQVKEQA